MSAIERDVAGWWGDFEVGIGEGAVVEIGPLTLYARRDARTWTLRFERDSAAPRDRSRVRAPGGEPAFSANAHFSRVAFRATHSLLRLRPALPDRVLVVAPETRFSVAPREELMLFARVPVWLRVFAGDPPDVPALLREIITERLHDTWIGPAPSEGELGYASREDDFAPPDESAPAAHEAICPLHVNNRARSLLDLEGIRIPLPQLALHADGKGRLWTPTVNLVREPDGDFAELRIGEAAPAEAGPATREADARTPVERSRIVRVFGRLRRAEREERE